MAQKVEQHHHRSALKQVNKPFKGKSGKSSANRKGKAITKSKKPVAAIPSLSKSDRKNRAKRRLLSKREEAQEVKDLFKHPQGPARKIFCIPLTKSADPCTPSKLFAQEVSSPKYYYSTLNKQRLCFEHASMNKDIGSVLLKAAAADTVIFVVSALDEDGIDEFGAACFSAVRSQGISSVVGFVQDLHQIPKENKRKALKAEWTELFKTEMATIHPRIYSEHEQREFERVLCSIHLNGISWREQRPYLHTQAISQVSPDVLKISGFARGGQSFHTNSFVHLCGLGDFPVVQLDVTNYKGEKLTFLRTEPIQQVEEAEMASNNDEMIQEEGEDMNSEGPEEEKTIVVPKGTSDYQSSWYSGDEEVEGQESESVMTKKVSFAPMSEATPSMMLEDEIDLQQLEEHRRRAQESKKQFPDEFDLDDNVLAKERLSKYRGVKSLRTAEWDLEDSLPEEYRKVFTFQNYRYSRKRALNPQVPASTVGQFVELYISIGDNANNILLNPPAVVVGLLKHEEKPTVMHFTIRRTFAPIDSPLKSKDELLLVSGFRRYAVQPIFSVNNPGFKLHKLLRYLPEEGVHVASCYLPVTYDPCPVLFFNPTNLALVATGSVLECNPNRVILKRITLTGSPFKVHRRVAVVRFMFFNPTDIAWFKPVELETRDGRRGIIKESLGTHGYMKCTFDKQISQQDVVLMHLYKRIFPKWTTRTI